jgi:hypothetical protein
MEWLDGSDAGTRARYALRDRRLCNEGQFKMRGDTFHRLDDRGIPGASELFEFKDLASQSRILCFFDGEKVVLLAYAFGGKKEDKTRPGEILQGLKARSSYLKRAVRHQQGSAAFGWKRRRQR